MKHLFPLVNIVLITAISFLSVDTAYKLFADKLNSVFWHKPIISNNSNILNPLEYQKQPLSKYKAIVERDIFQTNTSSDATTPEVLRIFFENFVSFEDSGLKIPLYSPVSI